MMRKSVSDLGVAAYLRMHGFKVIGRKNKTIWFEIKEDESSDFERLSFEYVNGPYHDFDANLMLLKKMNEYLPE